MLLLLLAAPALAAEPRHVSVDEALAMLDKANPTIERADAQTDEARATSLQALSAILPSLTATGSYVRNNKEVTLDFGQLMDALSAMSGGAFDGGDSEPLTLQPLHSVSGTVSVRVPLVAPSSWAAISASGHATKAADASLEATRSSLHGTALQAIWAEAAAESLVGAEEASAERAKELAATAERTLAAGTTTRLASLQAQTEVARREGDLLQARASLAKARIAVGVLLGSPEPIAVDLPPAPAANPVDADALVATAWDHRAEVAAANEQLAAARAQVVSANLGALPTLSGSFSAFASDVAYTTGDKTGWRASLDLTWPLLQGGYRAGVAAKARGMVAEAEAGLDAAKLQVSQQVRNAAADLEVAKARLDLAEQQRKLAEEAATVAQRAFEAGTLDSSGVLDALDRLDMARVGELDAKARVGMADAALHAATGEW